MSVKTLKDLRNTIYSVPIPKDCREGQFVFNRAEELFGKVARQVQFEDHIDCFHRNDEIDAFLTAVLKRLNNM